MIFNSVYYFNSGTSWVVPAGVTGIQVECFGSSYGFSGQDGISRENYPGGSYSKSNVINVTGGSTVYMNIGSLGGNTWFNTTNTPPTSASSTSSACLAVGGNTASASQIAANCGDVKYRGGNGLSVDTSYTTASGGQAGPNGNGADVVSQYTNTPAPYGSGYEAIQYSGGGANGGSSGSLGVPPYGRSGSGTAGSGAYWNGTSFISQAGTLKGGFMDVVGQYSFINNNLASTLTNYGPVGGGIVDLNVGSCCATSNLQSQAGFIVITLLFGRKYQILTGSGTWELPDDWNDGDNTIEAYGPGGNGGTTGSSSQSGGGGGGGAYVKAVNVPLKASDLAGYVVNKSFNTSVSFYASLWYGFSYFDVFTDDAENFYLLYAANGSDALGTTGGFGGSIGFCRIADVNYTAFSFGGGNGGNGRSSTTGAGGGGGGAAGPNGAGGAGGSNSTTNPTIGRGGGGGNFGTAGSSVSALAGTAGTGAGAGGNGGAANTSGSAGGAGTTVYSGGGGGGAGDGTSGTSGGAGGLYGGGGGGSGSATNSVGGAGRPGIIIISYIPIVTTTNSNFFMFF